MEAKPAVLPECGSPDDLRKTGGQVSTRPALTARTEVEQDRFTREYRELLRTAHPQRDYQTVPSFRRITVTLREES